jgi:hypothetical protein
VMLDSDLAALYGVTTRRFNEQVRRNEARFPADFSFELSDQEVANLKSQFATSSWMTGAHGGRRKRPRVFTEYGAINRLRQQASVVSRDPLLPMVCGP